MPDSICLVAYCDSHLIFEAGLCFLIVENAYIFDIKLFNKETIREAVLNAIAHRSMIVQNDVVIKPNVPCGLVGSTEVLCCCL